MRWLPWPRRSAPGPHQVACPRGLRASRASGALASRAASITAATWLIRSTSATSGATGLLQGHLDHRGHRAAPGPPRSPGPPGCSGARRDWPPATRPGTSRMHRRRPRTAANAPLLGGGRPPTGRCCISALAAGMPDGWRPTDSGPAGGGRAHSGRSGALQPSVGQPARRERRGAHPGPISPTCRPWTRSRWPRWAWTRSRWRGAHHPAAADRVPARHTPQHAFRTRPVGMPCRVPPVSDCWVLPWKGVRVLYGLAVFVLEPATKGKLE